MFETLDDSNFILFAAKSYDASYFDQLEFEEDLKRIKYIGYFVNIETVVN